MEGDDIRVGAVVHDVQLSDNLFPYLLLGFDVDDLPNVQLAFCKVALHPNVSLS